MFGGLGRGLARCSSICATASLNSSAITSSVAMSFKWPTFSLKKLTEKFTPTILRKGRFLCFLYTADVNCGSQDSLVAVKIHLWQSRFTCGSQDSLVAVKIHLREWGSKKYFFKSKTTVLGYRGSFLFFEQTQGVQL